MQITLLVTISRSTGPDATRAEITDQLVEEVASITQLAVEHTTEDGTRWADYTIDTVQALPNET